MSRRRDHASEFPEPIHEIQFEQVLGRSVEYPNPNPNLGLPMQTQSQNVQQIPQQGFSSFYPNYSYEIGESSSRNARVGSTMDPTTQQTLQQGMLGLHLDSYEVGESSSARNVRMRMNIEEPLLESLYPTIPVTRNPSPPPTPPPAAVSNPSPPQAFRNSVYNPSFEMRGLPLDPHLRLLLFNNSEQPEINTRNTLYDPSFALRGLHLDPHLRCFALEMAKKNGNADKLDLN
ncbi:unnamed protein product [Sphenostylis stenocarpa]|uniref:Uncharacterized protein n=1 Tax=Sphenostylis stenocarpa TaxID=92480 RepID=A0AA86SAF8_9FABA|nr:unnamed protein product [Sphenostylis stenocarpa]